MTKTQQAINVQDAPRPAGKRKADGRTYLVVADGSEEFRAALLYALNLARLNKGHVAVVHVQDVNDFMHWGAVEHMVRQEMRAESEKLLWHIAKECNDYGKHVPSLYCKEGKPAAVIAAILEEDPLIGALILAAPGAGGKGQTGLIGHFTGKALSNVRIPVIIVPGCLKADDIEHLI